MQQGNEEKNDQLSKRFFYSQYPIREKDEPKAFPLNHIIGVEPNPSKNLYHNSATEEWQKNSLDFYRNQNPNLLEENNLQTFQPQVQAESYISEGKKYKKAFPKSLPKDRPFPHFTPKNAGKTRMKGWIELSFHWQHPRPLTKPSTSNIFLQGQRRILVKRNFHNHFPSGTSFLLIKLPNPNHPFPQIRTPYFT